MPFLLFDTDLFGSLIFARNQVKETHSIINFTGKNKDSLIYIERLSYVWIYLHWTERGLLDFALQRPEAPGPPCITTHSFEKKKKKRGAGLLRGTAWVITDRSWSHHVSSDQSGGRE